LTNDSQRIGHILQAIEKICKITSCTREDFLASSLKKDATLYNLLVIGEAANKISSELQMSHPEIPWKVVIGMRNILIHDYVQTNYGLIWKTATEDLPLLQKQLLAIQCEK